MVQRAKDPVASASEKVNAALVHLKSEDRRRVLDASYALWVGLGTSPTGQALSTSVSSPTVPAASGGLAGGAVPQPEVFMDGRGPQSGVERVACLAYYLTRFRNKPKFKTKDIEDLNSEAHQSPILNARVVVDNAT